MTTMNASGILELQTLKLISITEQEINETTERLRVLKEEKQTLEKFLEIYYKRIVPPTNESGKKLNPQMFIGKTIRESLRLIANNNIDKIVVAKDAVRLLKEANVFGNPTNASSVVYSALKNPEFSKVEAGIFRLSEHKRSNNRGKSQKRIRKPSLPLLKEKMQIIKSQNPNITKLEMIELLIKQGFDFETRNPMKSINRAWLNLGYDKVTQQPLFNKPEVNVIQVPDEVSQKINP